MFPSWPEGEIISFNLPEQTAQHSFLKVVWLYDTAADAQAALNAFIQANNSAPIPFNGGIGSSSNWSGSVYSGIAEVEPVWVEGVGNNVASLYYRPGYWAAPEGGYVGIMGNYYGTKWGFQCTRTCAGS